MSYILDALRRSDQERQQASDQPNRSEWQRGAAADRDSAGKSPKVIALIIVLIVMVNGLILWWRPWEAGGDNAELAASDELALDYLDTSIDDLDNKSSNSLDDDAKTNVDLNNNREAIKSDRERQAELAAIEQAGNDHGSNLPSSSAPITKRQSIAPSGEQIDDSKADDASDRETIADDDGLADAGLAIDDMDIDDRDLDDRNINDKDINDKDIDDIADLELDSRELDNQELDNLEIDGLEIENSETERKAAVSVQPPSSAPITISPSSSARKPDRQIVQTSAPSNPAPASTPTRDLNATENENLVLIQPRSRTTPKPQNDSASTQSAVATAVGEAESELDSLPRLTQLPRAIQRNLPRTIEISSHIYSTTGASSVTINGQVWTEGQTVGNNLILEKITRDGVVFRSQNVRFVMGVLRDWSFN